MSEMQDLKIWFTEYLYKGIESTVMRKQHRRDPYYIFIIIKKGYDGPPMGYENCSFRKERIAKGEKMGTKTVDWSDKVVVSMRKIIFEEMDALPILANPPLCTSMWKIDNKSGKIECMYILPPDKPLIPGFEVTTDSPSCFDKEEGSEFVMQSAMKANSPIIWN